MVLHLSFVVAMFWGPFLRVCLGTLNSNIHPCWNLLQLNFINSSFAVDRERMRDTGAMLLFISKTSVYPTAKTTGFRSLTQQVDKGLGATLQFQLKFHHSI